MTRQHIPGLPTDQICPQSGLPTVQVSPQGWRDNRTTAERGYGNRWRKARATYLRSHPLCVMCRPRLEPATVVDHIKPHKGDQVLFWDTANWQSLCKLHHDSWKKRFELTGIKPGCDSDGIPIDPGHHWK